MKTPWGMKIVLNMAGSIYTVTRNFDFLSSVVASFPAGTLHLVARTASSSRSLCPCSLETLAERMCLFLSGSSKWTLLVWLRSCSHHLPSPGVMRLILEPGGGADHLRTESETGHAPRQERGKDARKAQTKDMPWTVLQSGALAVWTLLTPGVLYSQFGTH